MKQIWKQNLPFIGIILIGIIARFLVASLGQTFDMESFFIVGKIVANGGNVYELTTRYNYGPAWALFLGFLYSFAHNTAIPQLIFRFGIVGLLTISDILLFRFIKKQYSPLAAILYYLHPISIVITGYYSQFDNIALLVGLTAITFYETTKKNKLAPLALLGFSLVVKHVFILFPIWMAMQRRPWKERLLILCVPLAVFGVSFIPFMANGIDGIRTNVVGYASFNNAPLYHALFPVVLQRFISPQILFAMALLLGAYFARRMRLLDSALFYLAVLVTFSNAIADQYFILVLPFIAVHFNIFYALFSIVQSFYMYMIMMGGEVVFEWLRYHNERTLFGYKRQLTLLFFGLAFSLLYKHLKSWTWSRWKTALIISAAIGLLVVVIPAVREQRKVKEIEQAIHAGDYERANTLYSQTQIKPPYAGSRYYFALGQVRWRVEYYRKYRQALDLYVSPMKTLADWQVIVDLLDNQPHSFLYKDDVNKIRSEAMQHIR